MMRVRMVMLAVLALGMTRCAMVDEREIEVVEDVITFRVGPLAERHGGESNYFFGFVVHDRAKAGPTQVVAWLTNSARTGKAQVYGRDEPAVVYGEVFRFPAVADGSGLYALREGNRVERLEVEGAAEAIEGLMGPYGAPDLEAVRALLEPVREAGELTQFTR